MPESFLNEGTRDAAAARPRLQTIRQEILSRTRLERILEELNPYPERAGKRAPLTSIVEGMRRVHRHQREGQRLLHLEYTHRDPKMAQAVTARLATLFIEESSQARKTQVEVTGEFIESQLAEARQKLEEKEKALRQYKESRMGRLPGADRRQPGHPAAAAARAAVGERQPALRTRARHAGRARPVGVRRGAAAANDPAAELAAARNELAALRARYTDEHPDVKAVQARVSRLEKQVAGTLAVQPGRRAAGAGPRRGAAPGGQAGGRRPPHRDVPGPRGGDAPHRAGAGHADPRLPAAQPELPGPAPQEDGRADGGAAAGQVEDRQFPHPGPGLPARAAGLAEPLALPVGRHAGRPRRRASALPWPRR